MGSEIPEWAMEEAASLRSAVVWQSNASNEVIALALVAAERRGIERAADAAEAAWLIWDQTPGSIAEGRDKATCAEVASFVRQLGDTP